MIGIKNKQKVLYIVTNSDLGGISKYLLEITKHLPDYIEPYYVMATCGYLSEELEKLGIDKDKIFFVPMTNSIVNIPLHIKSNREILEIAKTVQPDLIHCNATTGAMVGAVLGAFTKIPTVYTVHGWPFTNGLPLWKRIFYKILEFFMCKVYKKIICVSEYDRQIGIKALPMYQDKMVTIHNGISDISEEYRKKYLPMPIYGEERVSEKDELKIVMITRFCPQKDPYTLIFAVHELVKEGYNIKLDLYGYGQHLDKVLNCIKNQNDNNIQYKGEISDVSPILKNYDVYALISNWEGLPIGIIEGMRAGLPILVSDVGGNSECIKDNGYLVERQGIMDCRKHIKAIWDNRENIATLGENSRKYFEEEFLSQKMTEKTLEEYKV